MEQLTGYEQFILASFELCQKVVKDYSSKFSKKTYRQCQLLTLILLRRRNKWTYREAEEQILSNPRLQELLGLLNCPDYSTLQKFYKRLGRRTIEELFAHLMKDLKKSLQGYRDALGDSTGYRLSNAGPHYLGSKWAFRKSPKKQGRKPARAHVKHMILVEDQTLLIFSQNVSFGPSGDTGQLKPVGRSKPPWIRIRRLALDKGFDSLENHRYVRSNLKAKDAICIGNGRPERMNHPTLRRWKRYFPKTFYRKRSKVEGCISAIKRKFSGHVLSRIKDIQLHEVLLLGIIYNIHRGLQLGLLILFLIEDFNRTPAINFEL